MRKISGIVALIFVLLVIWRCKEDVVVKMPTPYAFPEISNFSAMPPNPENPATVEGVALGKKLFFDPILSLDKTVSCGTCHKPELSFADNLTVTPGVNGAKGNRNAMTLVNLAWYEAFQWDGQDLTIRSQNIHPVEADVEMNLGWPVAEERLQNHPEYPALFEAAFPGMPITRKEITKALEQFQRTLISYNAPFDKFVREEGTLTASELRGFEIFRTEKGDCFHCHSETNSPELFVTTRLIFTNNGMDSIEVGEQFADNGFGDISGNEADNGKFKIPTLRNLKWTAPYMHDGRFQTLEEVIDMYNRGPAPSPSTDEQVIADAENRFETFGHWGLNLSEQDKIDLKNFLLTLSDEEFVNNPEFRP